MAAPAFIKPTDVKIKVSFYSNCDDVQLTWRTLDANGIDSPVEGSIGFMIERLRKTSAGWPSTPEILLNRVGFTNSAVDPNDPKDIAQPSSIWPFQRYDWTEHGANNNDFVKYRISCMGKKADTVIGKTELDVIAKSDWTDEIAVSGIVDQDFAVYFNRGTVMSQYVARIAREKNWTATDISNHVKLLQEPLRIFLSGELRLAILKLLDDVIANPFLEIHAALFELADDELIGKLKQIGGRAHIILSDGANTHGDENKDIRGILKHEGLNIYDRILGNLGLGHNKILITVDNRTDTAISVLTGSTNWTPTGLCTQLNNGIIITNKTAAKTYYDYWKVLKGAGSGISPELVAFNGNAPKDAGILKAWFTRTAKAPAHTTPVDIKYLQDLVNSAKESILYVMFQPGSEPLASILQKRTDPNMYIRGVVSTVIASNQEKFELLDEQSGQNYKTDLIQPDGVTTDFAWWVGEVTRNVFLGSIGFAITHAKMIVIDAFSDNPIVVTGSHNFSTSASQDNDENFVVIKGNKKLAQHYAVACMATYDHYRWRGYLDAKLKAHQNVWSHLNPDPVWQQSYLGGTRLLRHLKEWCG
ncbi:phospholipase D-like domain-containing protein [Mucilaginibacter dorajii]|uniref:phospholipase D n=1 Tax=Mucilaginibacter dorajii TaxID=692994 RepID=A0ABP7PBE7_9SPHI|nr:phospholipase D-like domain-containing protein [Mucilaginibacter dorajii]MCS3734836.1 phosphatidylserine/phosphatidylglycerophosphate/cardiolipin synthase-like enzyme [Mucilaginibacter dorajii]